ncbi:uncharacterized protein FOMMEDRAFT_159315 [Fomitiporia mediterranea MF3/22]|uniref:uncharacterized protein n=1 Tax=Fomitiporia mediterranea (strain MF3/22) TaxID=694068 RepID=UPI0004407B75|nr:uncharacterized protein FOMMEDRAFT_159315 [Fomitiporia mediterranea MF3/22]EJD00574.1 hypothetical protein FOMMEDRAFT_159315 [Fomitiporia mediterranea MF3/22]
MAKAPVPVLNLRIWNHPERLAPLTRRGSATCRRRTPTLTEFAHKIVPPVHRILDALVYPSTFLQSAIFSLLINFAKSKVCIPLSSDIPDWFIGTFEKRRPALAQMHRASRGHHPDTASASQEPAPWLRRESPRPLLSRQPGAFSTASTAGASGTRGAFRT